MMKSLLSIIEERASGPRLAGIPIKTIWVASLYRAAPIVLTITWGMPETPAGVEMDAPPGIEASVVSRPADTCILLPPRERICTIEAEILAAAWQLGAWDVRRCEQAPLANPSEYGASRHGIVSAFGGERMAIMGNPLQVGDAAPGEQLVEAAKSGYLLWQFVPLALGNCLLRSRWGDKDKTLRADGSCRRDQKAIDQYRLFGPLRDPGTAHDHIYQMGRANHGNRAKQSGERRA